MVHLRGLSRPKRVNVYLGNLFLLLVIVLLVEIVSGATNFNPISLALPTAQWKPVTFSTTNISQGRSVLWTFPPGVTRSEVVVDYTFLELDKYSLTAPFGIEDDLHDQFPKQPYVFLHFEQAQSSARISFRYRLLATSTQTISIPGTTDRNGWIYQNFTADSLPSSSLRLTAPNSSCMVSGEFFSWSSPFDGIVFPFGFNPAIVHQEGSKTKDESFVAEQNTVFHSNGPDLGLRLEFTPIAAFEFEPDTIGVGPFTIGMRYRALCLDLHPFASPNASSWQSLLIPVQDFELVPSAGDTTRCWTEIVPLIVFEENDYYDFLEDMYHYSEKPQGAELRVTCPGKTTALLQRMQVYKSPCATPLLIQGIAASGELAFRQSCNASDMGPRLPPNGLHLLASAKKKKPFSHETGMKPRKNLTLSKSWTIQATRKRCHVRLLFHTIDLDQVAIYEDFSLVLDRKHHVPNTVVQLGDGREEGVPGLNTVSSKYRRLTYISCTDRVFVETPFSYWSGWVRAENSGNFRGVYSQVCGAKYKACGMAQIDLAADFNWKSITFNALNFNQIAKTEFLIRANHTSGSSPLKNMYIEIQFLSLVQQTYLGYSTNFEYVPYSESEIRGVWIIPHNAEHKVRATLGGSQHFRLRSANETLRIVSNLVLPRGNHVFEARYRLYHNNVTNNGTQSVPLKQSPDVVLKATSKKKTLTYNIPKAFSHKRRKSVYNQIQFLDRKEYEGVTESGYLETWAFRYRWLIRPQNSSCRVVVRFAKMDIGVGYIAGPDEIVVHSQHRLIIAQNVTRGLPKEINVRCSTSPSGSPSTTTGLTCSRLDTNYYDASFTPSAAVGIIFQSSDYQSEYEEYDPIYSYSEYLTPFGGLESTWGTGWSATYWQACTHEEIAQVQNKPVEIKAQTPWQSELPGFPKQRFAIFITKRWRVSAQSTGCSVEIQVENPQDVSESDLLVFHTDNGSAIDLPFDGGGILSTQPVTIVLLGVFPSTRFHLQYRQVCP